MWVDNTSISYGCYLCMQLQKPFSFSTIKTLANRALMCKEQHHHLYTGSLVHYKHWTHLQSTYQAAEQKLPRLVCWEFVPCCCCYCCWCCCCWFIVVTVDPHSPSGKIYCSFMSTMCGIILHQQTGTLKLQQRSNIGSIIIIMQCMQLATVCHRNRIIA